MQCKKCKKECLEEDLIGELCQECFDKQENEALDNTANNIKQQKSNDVESNSTIIAVIIIIIVIIAVSVFIFNAF